MSCPPIDVENTKLSLTGRTLVAILVGVCGAGVLGAEQRFAVWGISKASEQNTEDIKAVEAAAAASNKKQQENTERLIKIENDVEHLKKAREDDRQILEEIRRNTRPQ